MREHYHHHEELERPERGRRSDGPHYHEESEHSARGRRGERREGPRHEESEHSERGRRGDRERDGERREGPRHHASWRYADEEGPRHGQRRERVERGMLRYLLLDALRHGPKHGYEMIKWLEDQTYGRYAPSAGIVYPTLQLLEDQGLILAQRAADKSVYRLTELGEAELQTHADFLQDFWERYGHPVPPPATQLEIEFVAAELQDLHRTVETGVRVLAQQSDQHRLVLLRQALERSKQEIRTLLAQSAAPQTEQDQA